MRQVDEIAERLFRHDDAKKNAIISEAEKILKKMDITSMTPPEATTLVHSAISKLTGIKDLYKDIKKENNEFALSLYPKMEKMIRQSKDKLLTAIRLSIAGNIIDYGAHSTFDINSSIKEALTNDLMINDHLKFKADLAKAKKILIVGDNAGEIVFDKLLAEEIKKLGKEVIFAVKSRPILNDVLMDDAKFVSMTQIAKIIESGSDTAGTILKKTTEEFKVIYSASDIVIAKGQGNLETLEDKDKNIYFLLKCKCEHLARRLKCQKNDIILVCNSNKKYNEFLGESIC